MTNPFYPKPRRDEHGQPRSTQPAPPPPKRSKSDPVWPWALGGIVAGLLVIFGVVVVATVNEDEHPTTATTTSRAVPRPTTGLSPAESERNRQAAEAERARIEAINAARFDRSTYEMISDRDLALLAKSPDAAKGRKLVLHGVVTQFDSGTGATQFRASVAGARQDAWYDYDINVVISGSSPPVVANVVKDDLVTVYVEVTGSYRYDTTLGGSMTVPRFTANIVDVTGATA
ncbi:DUF2510 domain-containing protein [Rhodococcus koreensis]